MGSLDVRHSEIEDRFRLFRAPVLGEKQPHAAAIEKGQVTEGIKVLQAQHLAIPLPRGGNVFHPARDLAHRTDMQGFAHDAPPSRGSVAALGKAYLMSIAVR